MPTTKPPRPPGVVIASAGSALVGLALIALAIASLATGHGEFSGGVGAALIVYAAGMIAAALALWRLSLFGRGPVIATSLLNIAAGYSFTGSAPWIWVIILVSAVTVVAAAWPSTSQALHLRRLRTAAEHPPKADQGS